MRTAGESVEIVENALRLAVDLTLADEWQSKVSARGLTKDQ
jgi:hypothetical protein